VSADAVGMHAPRPAWAALRLPLIVLALTLAAAAAIVHFSEQSTQQARAHLEQLKMAQLLAQQQFLKSGEEMNTIVRYLADYQRLRQAGFIGAERRIDWLDALAAANRQTRLFGVEYSIDAQQAYAGELPGNTQLRLRQSPMKLRLRLLHEDDLARFLSSLAAQHAGVFSVNDCDLQRTNRGGTDAALARPTADQPNLQAECQLVWYTLDEPQSAANKAAP
jgi:hypothetical protein